MKTNTTLKIVAICVICAATLMSGCMEVDDPVNADDKVETVEEVPAVDISTPTPVPTQIITQTPVPTPTVPTKLDLSIGETAKNSYTEITVIGAYSKYYYDYSGHGYRFSEDASLGNTFIFANINIKNVGSERMYTGAHEFSITDSDGYRYDAEVLYMKDNAMKHFKELYQNQQMEGVVLFEVPKDAIGLKIQYDFGNVFGRTQIASWEIPNKE